MGGGVGYKRLMSQQTPQSTRPRSWLAVVILLVAAIVVSLLLAFCPKPKPVPASIDAPAQSVAPADAPKEQNN